jgi:O-antigen/teichoic acid export membrane protein
MAVDGKPDGPLFLQSFGGKIWAKLTSWRTEQDVAERFRRISYLLAGNVVGAIIGLVAFALTARALGPMEYGILALCFSYVRVVEKLVSFQSWQPLIKYGAQAQHEGRLDDLRQLLKFGLLLDIGAAFLGFAIAVALIIFLSPLIGISNEGKAFALLYCLVLPFQISGMPTAVLRLFGKFGVLAYSQVVSALIRVAFCLLGVAFSWGLQEFTLMWMGIQVFSSLSLTVFAFITLRKHGLTGVLRSSVRGISSKFPNLWRFAITANVSLTIRTSAFELDTLIVGYLADPVSAGLYHIAKRIGRLALQLGTQIQAVVYPDLAKLWSAARIGAFSRVVQHTQWLLIVAGLGFILGVYLTIEDLLRWTAGPKFVGAAPLVTVQTIAVMMTLVGTVQRSALLAMGSENTVLRSVVISTIAFHLTAFILVPQIGAMGVNIAHVVLAGMWMAIMLIDYRKLIAAARLKPEA